MFVLANVWTIPSSRPRDNPLLDV